jgi:hypothetical protein
LPSNPDLRPVAQNITVVDSGSTTTAGFNSVGVVTGTPTAGSVAAQAINGQSAVTVLVSALTGTLSFELSNDGGTTWVGTTMRQRGSSYYSGTTTGIGVFEGDVSGKTNFRVRATATITGTAVVTITFSAINNDTQVLNPVRIYDNTNNTQLTVKPASTAPVATDPAAVTTLSPNTAEVGTPATGVSQQTGGVGLSGWLSSIKAALFDAWDSTNHWFRVQLAAGSAIVGKVGIDQTTPGMTNGVIVNGGSYFYNVASSVLTRASNTTQYTANTTVCLLASVTACAPITISIANTNAGKGLINRVSLLKSGSTTTSANFTVWFFSAAPVVTTPAQYDDVAYAGPRAADMPNYIGNAACSTPVVTSDTTASVWYECTLSNLNTAGALVFQALSGATTIDALISVTATYTPVSAETFTVYASGIY